MRTPRADHCVTVRDRDTMEQIRLPISELRSYIEKKLGILIFLISKAIPLPKRRGIIYVSKYQNFTP